MIIRRATFDSVDVHFLRGQLAAHYLEAYGASNLDDDRPEDFAPPTGGCLVAYCRGEAVGTLSWRSLDELTAEAMRLYVAPAARGLGVARALADRAVSEMIRAGFRRAQLVTDMPHILGLAPCVTDVAADRWGQRVISNLISRAGAAEEVSQSATEH